MRNFLIILLVMQILLIIVGVWQITQGKIGVGLYNIILNFMFGLFNLKTIKKS
jgi:hypothetical protein